MIIEAKNHGLHKRIGDGIKAFMSEGYELILDQACGGIQQIPLFSGPQKSRSTQICKVDILILKRDQICIIIEIEESDITPTHVCGKFLTSALATYYIHKTKQTQIPMAKSVLFVQIVDVHSLSTKSAKLAEFINIEQNIQKVLPIGDSSINKYHLFCMDSPETEKVTPNLKSCILKHLSEN